MIGPLRDIRVVEASTGIAGGYAAKLFADAGADVIKVEPPDGDPLRRWTAAEVDLGGRDSALFGHLAASKRSVVGPVAELLEGADVVVEDGTLDPLPSGDGLVVVSITPYGRSSPWVDRPATEFTVQAECGSLGARGTTDRPPVQAGGLIAEWVAGAYGAAAALAATQHARRSGQGAHIDVSMAEVMCISTTLFTDLMMSLMGRPPLPQPPRVVEFPSILPTSDGWVGFNTNAAQMFEDFLVLIGRDDMVGKAMIRMDPAVRPGLEASAQAWTRQHTTAEVVEQASLFRIPVAPVGDGRNLPEHEHLAARRFYEPLGGFVRPKPSYQLNGERPPAPSPAPAVGEHSGRVEARTRPAPEAAGAGGLPMAGLKVLDLTSWWAGPGSTGLLAQLGADVIHVESVQRIDGMRPAAAGYFFGKDRWWEWSNFFQAINVDKRGLTLNLADPRGLDLAKRLIAWADLVVENYTPRVMEGFGLEWEDVRRINPRVVYARLPAYGLDGPWRDRVGFAQTMEAMSGLAAVTGYADGPPVLPRGPCDPNGAMHAAFAMLAALAARDATGEGQFVEAPLIESALNIAAQQVVEYSAYGVLVSRMGNATPGRAPQGVYPCRGTEQWVAISVATDAQWHRLRAALGDPAWATDPAYGTYAGRRDRGDAIDKELAEWAAGQELDDAVERLVSHGVPAGAVRDFRSISSHPLFQARGFFETVEHPVVGTHQVAVLPFRWSGIDRWVTSPAPTLGQHNHEVLAGILGLSDEEIAALEEAQVIGDRAIT
jgi:crotonobetainyl-CoA:carnitine CoA-transferase CaiB-like acyl-CoA transferase